MRDIRKKRKKGKRRERERKRKIERVRRGLEEDSWEKKKMKPWNHHHHVIFFIILISPSSSPRWVLDRTLDLEIRVGKTMKLIVRLLIVWWVSMNLHWWYFYGCSCICWIIVIQWCGCCLEVCWCVFMSMPRGWLWKMK